jgi:hypothetical protein
MKISYRKTFPTMKEQIRICSQLAREYAIPTYFVKKLIGAGSYLLLCPGKDRIYICIEGEEILSAMFHELGHAYCYRNGKWPMFHSYGSLFKDGEFVYTNRELRGKILTGYKAECWVDRWAKKEMAKYFPNLKYRNGYVGRAWTKKWLMDTKLIYYKTQLDTYGKQGRKITAG